MLRKWRWRIDQDMTRQRADLAILNAIQSGRGEWEGTELTCSRSQVQRLIAETNVLMDGEPIRANSKLKLGSQVEITFPPPRRAEILPENRPIDVLYQDEHILVVNKPPNLTVHPSPNRSEGTLVNALLHHVRDLSGIGGVMRPGIVHRLDKDTSGVLVITKTDAAHRKLAEVFSRHEIRRVYWALCYGSPRAVSGKIESLIDRHPRNRKIMSMKVKKGRKAVTHFRRIEEYAVKRQAPFASWIEARLETGRTHQVRVHLTGLGVSLLNDPTYGTPTERQSKWMALPLEIQERVKALPGQALHSRLLGFQHPVTNQDLCFEAEPPPGFRLLLEALKKYV